MLKLRSGKEPKELPNHKRKRKTIPPKGIKHEETSQLLTEESSDAGSGFENSNEDRNQEVKLLELIYTKGSAAYRSERNQKK